MWLSIIQVEEVGKTMKDVLTATDLRPIIGEEDVPEGFEGFKFVGITVT